ncbi:MAG TPA: Ig-like domain-containing protein [Candidatus Coproplasma stercorigallinarum]|nr:Ig-like domain-containing protein [Candidatus Coproplasma stercorigallinarum]
MKRPLKALIAAILPATLAFSALMSACTDSHTHTLTPVAAKEATCTEAGNIAYWFCDDCDKYFSDAEAENEITQAQTVISALGHKWSALWTGGAQGHWHECDVCHEADSVVAHADANTDGVCDVCGYTISAEEPDPDDPIVVTGITLDKTTATVEEGATVALTATVTPGNATDKTVTWSTSNEAIATVSGGVVTGVKAGEVTITAKAGDKSATCTVTVTAAATEPEVVPVTGVTLSQTAVTLDIDQSITLTATVAPENATNKAVRWASDKTDVATVDANGKVTAVAAGTANITVTTADGGKTATCAVTVNPATDPDPEDPTVVREWVDSALDYNYIVDNYGTSDTTEVITVGKFTFDAKIDFVKEHSSFKGLGGVFNTGGSRGFEFDLSGSENKISFYALSASTGATTNKATLYHKVSEDWVAVEGYAAETVLPEGSTDSYVTVNWENIPAGEYRIETGASVRIAGLKISEYLEASDPASIEVSGGQTAFIMNDEFSSAGLNVTLVYENGRRDSVTQYDVISTDYNPAVAGTYTITVSYTPAGATAALTDTYEVNVYEIKELELFDYTLSEKRVTQNLQKVFLVGGEFNSANLAVQGIGYLPGGTEGVRFNLILDDDYTVNAPSLAAEGKQTVTVTLNAERGTAPAATYEINVVKNVFTQPKGTYTVNVDAAGEVAVNGTSVTFTSINDALKYLEITGVPSAAAKVINVAAGDYFEKIEVSLPNVSIIGTGETADKVVIHYDAIAGAIDPSGKVGYSTDGSATISIRESATGFYAENITFQNDWNTNAEYEESKELYSDTQAVAALVQADMSKFINVRFSSYHDTLYAMTGRQYYENCYIEGRTDYVFGYNATAYFKNTTLMTIGSGDKKNGGYVVATKGFDEGAGIDAIAYGYIFDDCTFTADSLVTDGTVSLARGWGSEMKMMVMNSTISKAYSKEAYGEATLDVDGVTPAKDNKNDRYGKMNAEPVAEYLLEYNNTGDGAITASLENTCTVITVEEAAKYADFATIFGTTNGKVTYAEAWVPVTEGETVAVTGVTLDKKTLELTVGEGTAQLVATIAPEGATDTRLVWLSSDEKVATVDENGVVTPVGEGNATITVVTVDGNFSDTCAVTVNAADPSQAVTFSGILDDYMVALTEIGTGLQGNTVYYFNTDGTITTDANATTGIISFLGNNSSVEVRSGTATSADGSKEFNNFMNMGGSSNSSRRQFIVDLSDYVGRQVTITAYAATGSGGKARPVYIYDDSSKLGKADGVAVSAGQTDQKTLDVVTYTVTVSETTTYYVGCVENIRIYGVVVDII